ncbi:hypothetical protein NLG97_g789 [Lecanicillium saksenae]|uniref:Uncharacterized protein n=1 Tax=Lecanicillium saksenae TaxID=468837 RepID=A0ACC1R8Y2_9HYPO|nr:hypothetical protein NLG97_g789 [Lecanicillium saksenae]
MADVRALLRQQRQARRIEHPFAAYSDAGKLLCTLCREQIRAESQWESHLKGTMHQRRAVAAAKADEATPSELSEFVTEKLQETQDAPTADAATEAQEQEAEKQAAPASEATETQTQSHKRKVSDSDDADAMDLDDEIRRKRSRANISVDVNAANGRRSSGDRDRDGDAASNGPPRREANRTPPTLARRMSSTPSRGVELQIPSRPATPAHRDSSSSSTPGGSTLAGLTAASAAVAAHASGAASTTNGSIATGKLSSNAQVDEDEWAAFEAEMAATTAPYADDAVISAPAMNAEDSAAAAAAANGEDGSGNAAGSRKSRADLDIEGEREDATRALEDEFDDMQELEARVKRLKEKREELRKRTSSIGQDNGPARLQSQLPDAEKGPAAENGAEENGQGGDDEEDDDDDDEEDDWDGFRFRK